MRGADANDRFGFVACSLFLFLCVVTLSACGWRQSLDPRVLCTPPSARQSIPLPTHTKKPNTHLAANGRSSSTMDRRGSVSSSSSSGVGSFRVAPWYHLGRHTLATIGLAREAVATLTHTATPTLHAPITSCIVITILFYLILHPHMILPSLLLFFLRYVIWNWIYRVLCRGRPNAANQEWRTVNMRNALQPAASTASSMNGAAASTKKRTGGGAIVAALQVINPLTLLKRKKNPSNDDENDSIEIESHDLQLLNRILRPHIRGGLAMIGIQLDDGNRMLNHFQAVWARGVEFIELIVDASQWNDAPPYLASRTLVIGLVVAIWWSLYMSQAWMCALGQKQHNNLDTIITPNGARGGDERTSHNRASSFVLFVFASFALSFSCNSFYICVESRNDFRSECVVTHLTRNTKRRRDRREGDTIGQGDTHTLHTRSQGRSVVGSTSSATTSTTASRVLRCLNLCRAHTYILHQTISITNLYSFALVTRFVLSPLVRVL